MTHKIISFFISENLAVIKYGRSTIYVSITNNAYLKKRSCKICNSFIFSALNSRPFDRGGERWSILYRRLVTHRVTVYCDYEIAPVMSDATCHGYSNGCILLAAMNDRA